MLPTLAALDSFPGRRVALIVGGQDRGIDYTALAEGVKGRVEPTSVLTLPDSGTRISAAFTATATTAGGGFEGIEDCGDLDEAVASAFAWARPDGIVLLSPAAPSFGRFRDYRDRADHFAAAMRALASRRLPRPCGFRRPCGVSAAQPSVGDLDAQVVREQGREGHQLQ